MASPTDAVEEFMAAARRGNPSARPSAAGFIEHLIAEGYDLQEFGEEEWRGMAEELGLDEAEVSDFMEDVASYLE